MSLRRSSLVRLYPGRWRRRYGAEFRALLDDEPLSAGLVLDVLADALKAQLTHPLEEPLMSIHRLQPAAVVFAVVAIIAVPFVLAAAVAQELLADPAKFGLGSTMLPQTSAAAERWLVVAAGAGLAATLCLVALTWRFRRNPAVRDDLALFGRLLHRLAMAAGLLAIVGVFTVVLVVPVLLIVSSH
jgi:hypothetical protein